MTAAEQKRITRLIESEKGIFLDLGCGGHKDKHAIGMDKRAVPGVDIVHNIETFPWPLPDAVCYRILASHIFEHLNPSLMIDIMNECHRIMKPNGQLMIAMPYPGTPRFWQDPTHIKAWNEATPHYFNCEHPLWTIYEPKCWTIELNQWNSGGDINIIMAARPGTHEEHGKEPKD
jgi:SAM-dependent methyltransferase